MLKISKFNTEENEVTINESLKILYLKYFISKGRINTHVYQLYKMGVLGNELGPTNLVCGEWLKLT